MTRLDGEDRLIRGVNTLGDATDGEITFLANQKYLSSLKETKASAVIARSDVAIPPGLSALRCNDPYGAVTVAIITLHGHRQHPRWGLSPQASIDPSARIGANPNIAGGVTVAADVVVGDNFTVYPGCYLADGVHIGDDCTLFPNVVVYNRCELGNRVTIQQDTTYPLDGCIAITVRPERPGKYIKYASAGMTA